MNVSDYTRGYQDGVGTTNHEVLRSAAKTSARLMRWCALLGFVAGLAVGSGLAWIV